MKNQTFPKTIIFLMVPAFLIALIIFAAIKIPEHASAMSLSQNLFETIKSNPADDPVLDSKKNQILHIPQHPLPFASRMSSTRATSRLLSI